jgi:pimeloyl-ACP methyl ester carboxylesterase
MLSFSGNEEIAVSFINRAVLMLAAAGVSVTSAAAPPGTLSFQDPIVQTPAGAQAWRIRYWTTNDRGQPIQVTGVVIAPREAIPAKPRAVLAWTHGTWGVTERCAPSLSANFFTGTPGLTDAIRRGFVVVAPDFPGLGSPMTHAFLGGIEAANSTLDAVRAARQISGAASGSRFVVWGESQGGHAALWTAKRAKAYAPDLQLVGAAAAAPPTDLVSNLRAGSDPSIRAFLTAFTAYSWSRHYGAPLATLGNRSTQGIITRIAQNNCVELGKKPRLGTMLGVLALRKSLKNVDLGSIAPWSTYARQNSVMPSPLGVPLLIAQNPGDKVVDAQVTRTFATHYCRNGGRLQYVPIIGNGHETSAKDSASATLTWAAARFAGAPAPNNCGQF